MSFDNDGPALIADLSEKVAAFDAEQNPMLTITAGADMADAARALLAALTPPPTFKTPEEIALSLAKRSGLFEPEEPDLCVFSLEDLEDAVHAGIQAAWESWEPESVPTFRDPQFAPEGEPDEYRDFAALGNLGNQITTHVNLTPTRFQTRTFRATPEEVRHILAYLSEQSREASIRRGLTQSAAGDVVDLGDFTQYIDEESGEAGR